MTKVIKTAVSGRILALPAGFRRFSLVAALACSSLVTGCAFDNSLRDEADAKSAGDKGQWALSTAFAEKAYAAYPDVSNEFNLATGYENTGQNAKAIALYQDLVIKGRSTGTTPTENDELVPIAASDPWQMTSSENDDGSPMASSDPWLSDEAARRIRLMGGQPSGVTEYPEMNQ
jgi:hypothetical protein